VNYSIFNAGGIGCGRVPLKRLLDKFLNSTHVKMQRRRYEDNRSIRHTARSNLRETAVVDLPAGSPPGFCEYKDQKSLVVTKLVHNK
jgi:hypothetical protein